MAVVLLDVGNVVARARHGITHEILEDLGVPREAARQVFNLPQYADFSRGKIGGEDWYLAFLATLPQGKQELLLHDFRTAHDQHIYDIDMGVLRIFHDLTISRDNRIAVASNTNGWQTHVIETESSLDLEGLAAYGVYRSNQIRMLKQDPGYFEHVLAQIERQKGSPLGPENVYLVDDNMANLGIAGRLGIHPVFYDISAGISQASRKLRLDLEARGLL